MLQTVVHYSLHFLVPVIWAFIFFRKQWKMAYIIMLLTMLVDADHLLATPLFDPQRCSLGYHPLHSLPAIVFYILLLAVPKWRVRAAALGLLFHMVTDGLDCLWNQS